MSDPSALPAEPPVRPSRQHLVVPPRASAWPVALGAVASAAAGFGLVLFTGIGRSRPTDEPPPARPTAAAETSIGPADVVTDASAPGQAARLAHDASSDAPGLLPPPDDLVPSASDRWSPRGGGAAAPAEQPPADRYGDRYSARPVSHEASPELPAADPPAAQPMSRFSSPDLPPPPAAAVEPEPHEQPEPDERAGPVNQAQPKPTPDLSEEPPADRFPAALPAPADVPADEIPPPDLTADATGEATSDPAGAPAGDLTVVPAAEPPTAVEPPAAAAALAGLASPAAVRATVPDPVGSVGPDVAVAGRDFAAAPSSAPPAELPIADLPEPIPATAPVAAVAVPASLPAPPASPFAAAPPVGPAPDAGPAPAATDSMLGDSSPPPLPSEPAPLASPAGIEGQGLPGPMQLEGVQAPQLAVEKRGPREIQVGKPARYEILVRNVGAAVAHEVRLRDAVPQGTSLIATTPPASPATDDSGSPSDLVWMLGDLHPGGEVRVLVELMPETEGEVGSVASVSFRADATLRSRATKPALTLECPAAKPIRIGGDMEVALTVLNSGSGTATGVVVEAFLPETVSHRAGPELEFDVGQLRPGESKTIDLVLGTRSPGSQPARFVARADGGIEVDRPIPIQVTAPTLELAIDMPARRFLQRPATCSIAMVNTGTASARSVELAAQLPPGMKFVRANNAGWHDERSHRVLWNLEELPAGETGTVEVVVMPVQAGEQRITAAARSTDGPSDQAIHACLVEGLAAVAFQVADSEDPIEVDGLTEYVVRVANEGTKAASGVRLAANLLGDLEPVEVEGPGGHRIDNLAIEFEPLAKLGPGEEVVYRIRARGRRAGHQRVQVLLTSEDNPTPITKEEVTSVYDDR